MFYNNLNKHNIEPKYKNKEDIIIDFILNIQELYDNDNIILKIPKSIRKTKVDIDNLVTWLLKNKHSISRTVKKKSWNINYISSYIKNRNSGDAWIDYKFGEYNTRLFLFSKHYHKKKFIKLKNKKFILKIRVLNHNKDVLYFCKNQECIHENNYKSNDIFRINKPLFTGETYNPIYIK